MLQQIIRVGSIILLASAYLSAMERPTLKELAIKQVANLITAHDLSYSVKSLDSLSHELSTSVVQQLVATDKSKSALPIALLIYKLHKQQQPDSKQYQLRLLLDNNQQVELTHQQSSQLIQNSATIQNLIQDLEEQVEEIPLPLLTQEQITNLFPYISVINALNASNSALPILHQEIPETTALSSYYLKYTAIQHLKEHLTNQTIPTLCDLIIAASYLDIQSSKQIVNFTELVTYALGDKLLQSPMYQEEYNAISTLPANVQHMLVRYLIDNSAIRYALCGNSADVITNTVQTLSGHTDKVTSVSWSPDSKYIASGSGDNRVKVWDASSGTCIRTLEGHTGWVYTVSWSSDSNYIASSSYDKIIKVWDATTGTCIHTLTGHTDKVNSVAWSPDSKYIASGSADNTIRVWDTTTGTCIHTLRGHTKEVYSVSWSPNGNYIASGSFDSTIKVWDATTINCIYTLNGHTNPVWSISWSPDGKYLASGAGDKTIKIWDVTTGNCIRTLEGHRFLVYSVSWSPNGKHIASGSIDAIVKVWDAVTDKCIHNLKGHTYFASLAAYSLDGKYIASGFGDKTVKVWNIINTGLDNYLKTALSWEQALLLIRITNAPNSQQNIDLVQDKKALQCYNSLDQQVKQLIEPLLSERSRSALNIAKTLDQLIRANPAQAALFGVGLETGLRHCLRK